MTKIRKKVTIAVPSLNKGDFLDVALQSIFNQNIPVEVVVLDGGSTDNSVDIIKKWESKLLWWRTEPDKGQAAAVNEGIKIGTAPYVCWLNSDDFFLPGGLKILLSELELSPENSAVYGRCWNVTKKGLTKNPYPTAQFRPWLFAVYCFIAQPATLIRRHAWENVGGLDENLNMAFDYDLWWRLYNIWGPLLYVKKFVAANRRYAATKTSMKRKEHYKEAMDTVKRHYGRIPLKWYLAWPVKVNLWEYLHKLLHDRK